MTTQKKDKKKVYWIIKRYVLETYETFASSRKEALLNTYDPNSVIVTKETCKKSKH